MAWDSNKNEIAFKNLKEDDVIKIVSHTVSFSIKRTTSYKFAFFKSILDNLFNIEQQNLFLSYDKIAERFTEIYWNLIIKYDIKQMQSYKGKTTVVNLKLREYCNKYNLLEKCTFENLIDSIKLEIINEIKKIMLKNVVGAFSEDTDNQFYHFDKKLYDGIYLNPSVYPVLVKYKSIFEKQNYYEWIRYLEKVNEKENSYALASKLELSTKRSNLNIYRNVLLDFGQHTCFYCGKTFINENHVDHFIPWSFVKDDKIWNFVLSCPSCNSKKSNILPNTKFICRIKKRNKKLIKMDNEIVKADFTSYTDLIIQEMYNSAQFNGFISGFPKF